MASIRKRDLTFSGISICPGIVIGKAFVFSYEEGIVPCFTISQEELSDEVTRFRRALDRGRHDLMRLKFQLEEEGAYESATIIATHLEIMQDPMIIQDIESGIKEQKKNAEYIIQMVVEHFERKFNLIKDQIFRERFKDIQDVSRRLFAHLRNSMHISLIDIPLGSVVFSRDLVPSDVIEARQPHILGFVTETGGRASHAAIIAKSKGISYISDIDFPRADRLNGLTVIVDGLEGLLIVNPSPDVIRKYRSLQSEIKNHRKVLECSADLATETIDGHRIILSANVDDINDIDQISKHIDVGVGLFRSENLFFNKDSLPSEEEQFHVYCRLAKAMVDRSVVIRTFDVGGDKCLSLVDGLKESNPFLGCRAIRFLLKEKTIFKSQLRAILRASSYGNIKLLFPMISGYQELLEAKDLLKEVQEELTIAGVSFNKNIPVGCMIEVPSAAIICDILARECDFLSIGTNDLVQYTLAVDRTNQNMSYLYRSAHPSVIRLIKKVVCEAKRYNTPVSVCGEMAAHPHFTPLLLGLGVTELSVSRPSISKIKDRIRSYSIIGANKMAQDILNFPTAEEIEKYLAQHYQNNIEQSNLLSV